MYMKTKAATPQKEGAERGAPAQMKGERWGEFSRYTTTLGESDQPPFVAPSMLVLLALPARGA